MATVTTEVQLCNIALGFCGQRALIDSLTEESTEAQMCALFYPMARDTVLNARAWRFNTRRATLALTSEERSDWDYVYAAPAGMLKPHEIYSGMTPTPPGLTVPFDYELNDARDGFVILTNQVEAELIYSCQVNLVGLWSAPFALAVAWKLAEFLALAIPLKPALAKSFGDKYLVALSEAGVHDLQKAVPSPVPAAEVIRARS